MKEVYKISEVNLPLIPLRGYWVMPTTMLNFDSSRSISKNAVENAKLNNEELFLVNQLDIFDDNPKMDGLHEIGIVAEIKETFPLPNGDVRVFVQATGLGKIKNLHVAEGFLRAEVEKYEYIEENEEKTDILEALRKLLVSEFRDFAMINDDIPDEIAYGMTEIENYHRLVDLITYHLDLAPKEYYQILSTFNAKERMELAHRIINKEIELKNLGTEIELAVTENINQSQKEYYLREKMDVLKKELASTTGQAENEVDELRAKIKKIKFDKQARKSLEKDLDRLDLIPEMSPDYGVLSSYLDFVVGLPWSKKSKESLDIKKASEILDEDHYGLKDVKERILESIAVKIKNKSVRGSIICLVGPPGVGKTSIAKSVARALNREFVSMRLGGVTDESEIRGHRRTYVGAMAGRVIANINRIGVKNPVFLLDEIDKLGSDFRGDPSSALLEVLDPEQNDKFIDRYLDIPFDLSDVFFLTTANDINAIPDALFDRLEVIELSGYTLSEKLNIAKKYLIKKQMANTGLKEDEFSISDKVIERVIKAYTREAGVRELERLIGKICRRSVKEILEGKKTIRVTMQNYTKFLGRERFIDDHILKEEKVGVVNGLAWTSVGGTMLTVEANVMEGKGNVEFTGSLGDVMKESGQAALVYIRSNAGKLGIKGKFYEDKDIHVHVPEGATPKDGPSAGITMTTAIASALTGRKVKNNLAMTGEVTITGDVLAIGGLKEKALAAYAYGIKNVIIPKDNERDTEDIDKEIRDKINFIPVSNVSEVIERALI
ncbi:endopeptidase La [Anaerococcus lactolyticus ATCC 51172]|uniref:Lon protease n=1 Tax=Anaerococcus lactolyticus ATCC 51172 TaxID=525254 RepID=C2BH32_9FIRM|nr:endopeptidase La [Anaerococcus lactolyticus]EEI85675.1 endopeptidase La [Anaerococcus lactolyticus ATCC 51172]